MKAFGFLSIIETLLQSHVAESKLAYEFSGLAQCSVARRCVMRKFIAALALISLIAIPSLTQTANAADVSPASPAFGSNGY
jgi:hypothetical protein